jgi:hypothetical protein
MSKSKFFTGQPIFSQVLSFLPKTGVDQISARNDADRYCKHFTTYSHLVSMLYAVFNNCTSIRELTSGLLAWEHRITHLGVDYFPRRSTFSDATNFFITGIVIIYRTAEKASHPSYTLLTQPRSAYSRR